MSFLDTLEAWEDVSADPFTTIACGNMQPLGISVNGASRIPDRRVIVDGGKESEERCS